MKYTLHKLHNPARGPWRCKLIIGALLLSLVLGTVMGVWVSAETDAAMTVLDFKDPSVPSTYDVVIPQGEVVASLLGEIPDEEVAYLNTHSGYALVTSAIPKDKMLVHVLDDGLSVIAYAYSYTTAEGTTVTWLPFAAENTAYPAEVSLLDYDMDLDLYRGTLPGSKGDTVEIYYTASFALPQDTALSMINEAYFAGEHLMGKMQAYEEQYALWLPKHEQYTAYVSELTAWELQKALYDVYCEEQSAYDAWWKDHDEKEAAMNAYLAQKSAFETWEQYKKDLAAYEAYMELVHATPELKQEYEAQVTLAVSQLNLMERMFVKSALASGKPASFADVLGGGPADFILSNQTMLKQLDGVNSEDVDRCVRATFALRRLILGKKDEDGNTLSVGYQELTGHEAQYTFYIENREEVVFYLNDLYDAMMSLGSVEYVQKELNDRGAMIAFKNFLANLYVQSRLMDDTLELDRNLTYLDTPLYEMVEEDLIWEDTLNVHPMEDYPQPPFTSDDVPTVEYPGEAPPEVQDPGDAPAPVPDPETAPKEPTPVEDPKNPPTVVTDPGEAPMAPDMTEAERDLYEFSQENGLIQRTEADMMYGSTVYVTQRGAVNAVSGKRFSVKVMNHEGKLLQSRNLVFGTRFLDVFTPPAVNMGDGTVFTFVGWSLEKTPLPQNKEQRFHTISIDDVVMAMELYPVYVMCHHPGDAATCTEDQICTVCGEVLTPALEHEYDAIVTNPTCTDDGYTTHTCSRCGDTYTDTPTEKLGHTAGDAATCTENQICTVCSVVLTPSLGHEYEAIVTDPSCTADGYTTHTCSRCGDTYTDTPTKKLGHTAGDAATCTEDQICTVCGEVLTPALEHDYEAIVTNPTCTDDGYTTHTCSRCGDTYTDTPTEKLGHTAGDEATCTEDQICTVCGEVLTPALEHNYEAIVTKPTCTDDGYTTHTCSRCGDTYTDTPTEKLGHTAGDAATCTEDQICTVCGEVLTPALEHNYEAIVTKPTCAEDGYTTHTCSRCGDSYIDTPTEANGHQWGMWENVVEAEEGKDGLKKRTCEVCGAEEEKIIPALDHVHHYTAQTVEPTCTEAGYILYICICGETYRDHETPALEHDYDVIVTAPTCTEDGYTTHTCSRCGDTYTDTPTKKLEHTAGDAATCTEDQICTVCGAVLNPALEHDYEAVVTNPTCTDDGYTTHTCGRCGDTYTDTPTEKLGHTAGDEATCTEDQTCTVCGEVLTLALEHDYEAIVTNPTCTDDGYTTHTCGRCGDTYTDTPTEKLGHTAGDAATCTEDQICTVCGAVLNPALEHDYEAVVTNPTCTDDGYTTHTCGRCGDTYTDTPTEKLGHTAGDEATCTEDQTCTVCGEVLTLALEHDYEAIVTNPTCTDDGYTTHTCGRCGDTYTDTPTEKLGHTAGDAATCTEDQICTVCGAVLNPALEHNYEAVVTNPTCTEDGYTTHTCGRCGDTYTDTPTEKLGHTAGDAATCTEDQICTVCGVVLTPALEHDYEAVVTNPTCTEDGYTTHTCSRCGDTYTDTPTEKLGHTAGDAATCTEDQTCTVCGVVLTPALEHDYEAVVTNPTCTEDGYTTHTCSRCGDTYTDTPTKKLGHTAGDAATCTEDQICTVCGVVLTPALEHDYEAVVTNPTCTEDGYTTHTCSRCGDSYTDTPTESKDHVYGDWVTDLEAAPGVEGHKYAECERCGHRKEETIEALPPQTEETESEPDETQTEPPGETESDEKDPEKDTEIVTDEETQGMTETNEAETEPDGTSAPILATPEVKWYAKILGAVGLPALALIAGAIIGGGAAGITILVMRASRQKRERR